MKYVLFDIDGTLIDAVSNAQVAGDRDPRECLAVLHELEDEDVRCGVYAPFGGASELLHGLPPGSWALVTSNTSTGYAAVSCGRACRRRA